MKWTNIHKQHSSHTIARNAFFDLITSDIIKNPSVVSDSSIEERETQMILSKTIEVFRVVVSEGSAYVIYKDDCIPYNALMSIAAKVVTDSYDDAINAPSNNASLLLTGNTTWISHNNRYIHGVLSDMYLNQPSEFANTIEDIEDQYEIAYNQIYKIA